MVSSGDGPVGASKLTEEVGAIEGTLILPFWWSIFGLDVLHYRFHLHLSEARGPRKRICRRVSIFFSDAIHHGKPANYGKRHDRSGYQAENNCIWLKLPTISPERTPDNNFVFGWFEITLSIQRMPFYPH